MDPKAAGFMTGFFNQRTKMAEAAQEKQDRLTEKLQNMHIKGMEKRVEQWEKRDKAIATVDATLKEGDVAGAFALYSSAIGGMGAKERKAALGSDWEWTGDEKATRATLEAAIKRHRGRKAPTVDMESVQRIQLERGVDQLEMEGFLRNTFGIGSKETMVTPYKGVANNQWEGEAAELAKSKLWKKKAASAENVRLDVYDRIDPETGAKQRASRPIDKVTGAPLGAERVYGSKSEAPPAKNMTAEEKEAVGITIDNKINMLKTSEDPEEVKKAEWLDEQIGKPEERGPLFGVLQGEIALQRRIPGVTAADAANAALDHIDLMKKADLFDVRKLESDWTSGRFFDAESISVKSVTRNKNDMKVRIQKQFKDGIITRDEAAMLLKRYVVK
jgi:hypothetical protein